MESIQWYVSMLVNYGGEFYQIAKKDPHLSAAGEIYMIAHALHHCPIKSQTSIPASATAMPVITRVIALKNFA